MKKLGRQNAAPTKTHMTPCRGGILPPANMIIRLATPADAQDMAEVGMRSWEVAYKEILPADYIREKNATRPDLFKRVITDENQNSYVIQLGGKTVGIMKLDAPVDDDLTDEYYELHYIYLHPDYFRQGIGAKAMDFAMEKARELGKKHISLWVISENTSSVKFYEKCGYRRDGHTRMQNRGHDVEIIRMTRQV